MNFVTVHVAPHVLDEILSSQSDPWDILLDPEIAIEEEDPTEEEIEWQLEHIPFYKEVAEEFLREITDAYLQATS